MKRLALLLFWLAVGKIAVVEGLNRQALVDAVVAGHEPLALRACATVLPAVELAAERRVRVTAGDRAVDVSLWQVGHADWAARYRRATLTVDVDGQPSCVYDVSNRRARLGS
jgi:hypothetical protein